MYILSGKGSIAGVDLATSILKLCQQKGVLWDNDLPEYTLDFATQIPSVSKSIREGSASVVIDKINEKLKYAEQYNNSYMILCLTAHKLIPNIKTKMKCVNLWEAINKTIVDVQEPIAFLGTFESMQGEDERFITLPNHADVMGDLITSVKRGYSELGKNYAAHPNHLLKSIVNKFKESGTKRLFLACTDLHGCKDELINIGVLESDIISIIDIAANEIIDRNGRLYNTQFLDAVSDARTYMRYKYVSESDAPQTDKKTQQLYDVFDNLNLENIEIPNILDVGGSSTGHSLKLAKRLSSKTSQITLLDISADSLNAARPIYTAEKNITTTFEHGDFKSFFPNTQYDLTLCLGLLCYISEDHAFVSAINKMANTLQAGGLLITRDGLTDVEHKIYMAFGGVIRNRNMYQRAFYDAGFELIDSREFTIETPIKRDIATCVWRKLPDNEK